MKENTEFIQFGQHLTIDGYNGNYEKLKDFELVKSVIFNLPKELGMHTLGEPLLYEVGPNNKKDPGGITGIIAIAESHISIHTFPKRRFVSADVYTCQDHLDVELVLEYFKTNFVLEEIEWNHIKRGTKYPATNLIE